MKGTLLKRAREFPSRKMKINEVGKEDIELAIAWAKGEVTLRQVAQAYGIKNKNGSHVYARLARALREHYQNA